MRILLVTPECPIPLLDGVRLRTFNLFSRLARKHDVSLLTFAPDGDSSRMPALRGYFSEIFLVPRTFRRSIAHYASGAFSRTPFFVNRMHSSEMAGEVERLVRSGGYDVVHVSDMRMAHYLVPYADQPKVIDACDCLSLLYRRTFLEARSVAAKLNCLQLWAKTRAYESRVYPRFDRCTVVSQIDAEALLSTAPCAVYRVVPNGVDTAYYHPPSVSRTSPDSFIFVGVMAYAPNVDAARFFASQVLPRMSEAAPSASFEIVGRTPVQEVLDLQMDGNVHVVGDVDDTRPYVWRSAVCVCPLRFGAGIKNKVLEAMAMARPIVATSMACEGLSVEDGDHVLIADTSADFARECLRLIGSEEIRARLGARARLLVERQYSWETGVRALEEVLVEAAGDLEGCGRR